MTSSILSLTVAAGPSRATMPPPASCRSRDRRSWRYRGHVAVRTLAATVGAYGAAAALAAALARLLPLAPVEAVITGTLAAIVMLPAVAIWAFLARNPLRAAVGVIGLTAALLAAAWLAGPPA